MLIALLMILAGFLLFMATANDKMGIGAALLGCFLMGAGFLGFLLGLAGLV